MLDSSVSDFAISIHVPAWGTTEKIAKLEQMTMISIHVPAWGTTKRANE